MGEHIALGLGNNTDYEIKWNSRVFERYISELGITRSELNANIAIASVRDLIVSILGFMASGSGGERFVNTAEIVETFAKRFENKITIGGTSVRAAIAMRKLGYRFALHLVTMNDSVRRLIPADSSWVCSNQNDSVYPHLIVQFTPGTEVRAGDIYIAATRANRIIYNNDLDNTILELNPKFAGLISDARVLLISGFNAMRDGSLLADRLRTLKQIMTSLPRDAIVYYEDACFHIAEFSVQVREALIESINIYSLNEDELQHYVGRQISLLDPGSVGQALRDVQRLLPVQLIVVHTRYWALAYGDRACDYEEALKGGIAMATTRLRLGDDFTEGDYRETTRLPLEREGIAFAEKLQASLGNIVCCLPSRQVSQSNVTTIGLGDAFVGGFLPALDRE